jgi:hypothetical protein
MAVTMRANWLLGKHRTVKFSPAHAPANSPVQGAHKNLQKAAFPLVSPVWSAQHKAWLSGYMVQKLFNPHPFNP